MAEERLKLAVFIDFDNIQIGVKDTLGKDFDVSVVLEALKERGEVVSKTAYGDWSRAGDYGRQLTQHAVQMVQRNVTPRGDKNGADINLALDALEMAFTRDHISGFAIVGGDSDFIALVEKLKQYDKRVFVVGGRQFTSGILQRNCHEFIAYENLLQSGTGGEGSRSTRATRTSGRGSSGSRPLPGAMTNIERALKILAEREVSPQLGLLKSTLLQLDPTFTERDYGAGSFLEFIQKLEKAHFVLLHKTDRGYLVEIPEQESPKEPAAEAAEPAVEAAPAAEASAEAPAEAPSSPAAEPVAEAGLNSEETMGLLKKALAALTEKGPSRPIYLRQVRQAMRSLDGRFDERQSGFRGLLDILHQAQREGWVRLHRDRKGIWRIFPVAAGPAVVAPAAGAPSEIPAEVSADAALPEADVLWEVAETPEEIPPVELGMVEAAGIAEAPAAAELPEVMPPLGEEPAPAVVEPVPPKKTRKPRAKSASKPGQRKTASRRKTKEAKETKESTES